MLVECGVLVAGKDAGGLLELLGPEVSRRLERGVAIPTAVQLVLGDLSRAARLHAQARRAVSDAPSDTLTEPFRGRRVEAVNTTTAAARLGVTDRTIRNRCAARTLDGRLVDGRWVIDLPIAESGR